MVSASFRGNLAYSSEISDPGGTITDALGPAALSFLPGQGTGAGQVDAAYRDARTLTASGSYTYTLSALPGSVVIARARLFFVEVFAVAAGGTTSGSTLAVSAGGTNGWGKVALASLGAGSFVVATWPALAGAAAVASASDQLTFTATGAVAYRMAILGTTA